MHSIEDIKAYIKEQAGLDLEPCEFFHGLKTMNNGETYYNFLIERRYSESSEVVALERLANRSNVVYRVEPNGVNRIAVFFRNNA